MKIVHGNPWLQSHKLGVASEKLLATMVKIGGGQFTNKPVDSQTAAVHAVASQ